MELGGKLGMKTMNFRSPADCVNKRDQLGEPLTKGLLVL